MPSLRSIQQRLAAEILDGAAGRMPRPDGFTDRLRLPRGTDADRRLAVYRDGYPARILEALGDAFPAIANICGDASFAALVARYLPDTKVTSSYLNEIGRHFPAHCESDRLAEQLPFLADLAGLEASALRALHSADLPPVEPAAFAAWDMNDWERVELGFQPSTALVRSPWPIYDLWNARETARTEIDIDLQDRPQSVLVFRHGYAVEGRNLDRAEANALQSLMDGAPLGSAIERLAESDPDADTSRMFGQWLASGLIARASLT